MWPQLSWLNAELRWEHWNQLAPIHQEVLPILVCPEDNDKFFLCFIPCSCPSFEHSLRCRLLFRYTFMKMLIMNFQSKFNPFHYCLLSSICISKCLSLFLIMTSHLILVIYINDFYNVKWELSFSSSVSLSVVLKPNISRHRLLFC